MTIHSNYMFTTIIITLSMFASISNKCYLKQRNMKEMVESGISAKLEKADRFQRVKLEINEMIKARMAAKSKVKI